MLKINDKTAATQGLTFAAMNPKLGNQQMYDLVYEPTDSKGDIVNKSAVATSSVGWIIDDMNASGASASA